MNRLVLRTCGKINLALDVIRRREDGYHDVAMVMQSVAVADGISIQPDEEGTITLTTSDPSLGTGRENLAYRAAAMLREVKGIRVGARIHLSKNIPVAAGMGGGSADAAGVLVGLNRFWSLGLSQAELEAIALKLGADVPFCLAGGTALAEGIGEKLTKLPSPEPRWVTLVKPPFPVSTAAVYQGWDELKSPPHPEIGRMVDLVRAREFHRIPEVWGNALEAVTFRLRPEVDELWQNIRDQGYQVRMTGSGPTLFIWNLPDETEACRVADEYRKRGIWAQALTTCDRGIFFDEE